MKGNMLGVSAGLKVFPNLDRNKLRIFIMALLDSLPPAQLSENPQRLWLRGVFHGPSVNSLAGRPSGYHQTALDI